MKEFVHFFIEPSFFRANDFIEMQKRFHVVGKFFGDEFMSRVSASSAFCDLFR